MSYRKERKIKIKILFFCLAANLLLCFHSPAQKLAPQQEQYKWLLLSKEQYLQEQYALAILSAEKFLKTIKGTDELHKRQLEEVKFYHTVSLLKLKRAGSIDSAIAFIDHTESVAYAQRTAFALAQHHFNSNRFADAIAYYKIAGIDNLSNREVADAKFELAYCYFSTNQFTIAEPLLAAIKELPGKYYDAGNYYYGLIAYNQGNYTGALKSFKRIDNNKEYSDIVPYYIAEIYYFSDEKEKALAEAIKLIGRSKKLFYDKELHLLAAHILFEEGKYKDALPYYEYYYKNAEKIRKEDLYEMAYCYYRVEDWRNAIDKFKPLSNSQDLLGQTAMYFLGDCYLKIDDKKSARNAFNIAADMSFDAGQTEAATILAAKLSYELGYYDEAMNRANDLLTGFPSSQYRDEAKTLRSDLLTRTSNYADAYNTLADVQEKDAAYKRVYQKVAYGFAMQLLQDGDPVTADSLLSLSLQYPVNSGYEAAAKFWKGDMAYKDGRYADALDHSQQFIAIGRQVTNISPAATIANAYMNMGYAAMGLKDYNAAQTYFSSAASRQVADPVFTTHLALREADAWFMQKDFKKALELYEKVITSQADGRDHAIFQKAIIVGLQGNSHEKIVLLQALMNRQPASGYADDARYALAVQYIDEDKYSAAIAVLQPFATVANQEMAPKALMKIGFAWQQLKDEQKAIASYRRVVTEYPYFSERAAALEILKSLYLETNRPDAYVGLLSEINAASSDEAALDSAYYGAAEIQYAAGKWESAKNAFGKYNEQYPKGLFAVKAHYYKAESHLRLGEQPAALSDYHIVLDAGWSEFAEPAAKKAGAIAYLDKDYDAALRYYSQLRLYAMNADNLQTAYKGLMQAGFDLKKYEAAAAYADTLISLPGLDENTQQDALLYKARSLQLFNHSEEAMDIYQQIEAAKKGAVAAEARYHIAEIYLQQGKHKEAETAANVTIQQSAGNEYWVVKSYILLADIMTLQKDYFNAKATLQSIMKNTKIAELKEEASKKLSQVKALETKQTKLSE
jgi:tetratricopeptide (TPR) repeat protein